MYIIDSNEMVTISTSNSLKKMYSLLRILTINAVKYNLKFTLTKVEVEKMLAILD